MDIQSVRHDRGGGYLVNGVMAVPADPANRHYRAVQAWIEVGNTAAPADPVPAPEPSKIDVLEEMLRASGLLTPAKLESARTRLRQRLAAP